MGRESLHELLLSKPVCKFSTELRILWVVDYESLCIRLGNLLIYRSDD